MANVSCEHIVLDKNGVARIVGSRIKVNHLVLIKRINGLTPEQIQSELSTSFAGRDLCGVRLLFRPSSRDRRRNRARRQIGG